MALLVAAEWIVSVDAQEEGILETRFVDAAIHCIRSADAE